MLQKLTLLQEEQIELGKKNGLSERQIRRYAKPSYNFLQMQELRQAMENGLNSRQMRLLLHTSLSHQEMAGMRLRMERGEPVDRPYPWICMISAVILLLSVLGFLAFKRVSRPLCFELNQSEIRLKAGETFEPSAYIGRISNEKGKLILPADVDTVTAGHKAAVYRLVSEEGELVRILYVDVEQ